MEKIKILYYEPSSGFGGSSRCLRDWLLKLDRYKFQPFVAVLDDGPVIQEIKKIGNEFEFKVLPLFDKQGNTKPVFTPDLVNGYLNFFIYLIRKVLPLSFKLAKFIKSNGIHIVHINTPIVTGLEAILAARMTRTPSICHLHETRKWSRLERFTSKWVQRFICLTDEGKKVYQQYLEKNKLVRIYNGIVLEKTFQKNDLRQEFSLDTHHKLVGMVARLTEGKGHRVFLNAAKLILSENPDTKFLIVGDVLSEREEVYKEMLLDLAEKLGIVNNVIFTGWRHDIMSVISNMDILVQGSTTFPEGFSLTCIEAMALGVPLVVTDIPGSSEIVLNGITGLVVPARDPEAMANGILRILQDKEIAGQFSRAGRFRTRDVFDLDKIVNQIEQVYLNLIPNFGKN